LLIDTYFAKVAITVKPELDYQFEEWEEPT